MSIALRVVWRLDFSVNYMFLDKYGSAAKAIFTTIPSFFNQVAEGAPRSSLVGSFADEKLSRNITLDITSLSGSMEWPDGVELERLEIDEQYRNMNRIADEIIKLCEIKQIVRGGFRAYCVDSLSSKVEQVDFMKIIRPDIRFGLQDVLGKANDIGIVIEGRSDDSLNYRVSFGPFAEKNVSMALERDVIISKFFKKNRPDIYFDVDIYENSFNLAGGNLFRWSRTKLAKVSELATFFQSGDLGG